MSMGLSWLFQDLPKLGNSNAIKLLKVTTLSALKDLVALKDL